MIVNDKLLFSSKQTNWKTEFCQNLPTQTCFHHTQCFREKLSVISQDNQLRKPWIRTHFNKENFFRDQFKMTAIKRLDVSDILFHQS